MTFKPAPEGTGIVFRRVDQDPPVEIPAHVDFVPKSMDVPRNTTLERDGVCIHTVEHVLAAVAGLGIDNVYIELDTDEPGEPSDGSCRPFVDVLREAGKTKQSAPRRVLELKEALSFQDGDIEITAVPYDGLRVSFTIHYDNPTIGTQQATFDVDAQSFAEHIAPARTFALMEDVVELRKRGFIRGGTLDNAVVVDGERIVNEEPLRFPDEFVRHKILDLIGDLTCSADRYGLT